MNVKLRLIQQNSITDKENYYALQDSVALFPNSRLNMKKEFLEQTWLEQFQNPNRICYVIETDENSKYCGECAVKDISLDIPELEIELMAEWRHQGIGYQAIQKMLDLIKVQYQKSVFYAKIEPDNYVSQFLFEKLGGIPEGITKDYKISDDRAELFVKEHKNLIDEDMRNAAKKFNVAQESLLTNLLVYKIDVSGLKKTIMHDNRRVHINYDRALSKAKYKDAEIEFWEELQEMKSMTNKDELLAKLNELKAKTLNKMEKMKNIEL